MRPVVATFVDAVETSSEEETSFIANIRVVRHRPDIMANRVVVDEEPMSDDLPKDVRLALLSWLGVDRDDIQKYIDRWER